MCRMEQVELLSGKLTVYIDVAHNESGIEKVLDEI